jgi:hypothetical protein
MPPTSEQQKKMNLKNFIDFHNRNWTNIHQEVSLKL